MCNQSGTASAAYLIVVQEVVVAQDLAQTISDHQPGAHIIMAASLNAAIEALIDVPRVEIAFVAADPQAYLESQFAKVLAARGAQVVLMGVWGEVRRSAQIWNLLPFPFTTDDVRGLMAAHHGRGASLMWAEGAA